MASSWYVVKDSDNENIKYFKDENGDYVSGNWAQAQTSGTLSGLLNEAISAGDVIYISGGTYLLGKTITLSKAVSIYGGFSDSPTILSGQDTRQVLSITANASLDRLTITKGRGDFGGGIYIYAASPTITNCSITDNTANNTGGGFYMYGQSSPVITNCSISGNKASSGGGGGFDVSGKTTLTITDCSITNNSAGSSGGGISVSGSNAVVNITNSTVTNNSTNSNGGGISIQSKSTLNVLNCTIANNLKASAGLEVHNASSTANFINSIIWNENAGQAIVNSGMSSFSYTNCALPSGITGGTKTFTLNKWDNPQTSTLTLNGVTHTVYSPANNSDLQPLVAAGTSTGAPSTDQLGATRRLPPSIGSVEGPAAYYVVNSGSGEDISYIKTSGDYDAAQASVNSTLSAFMKASISGDIVYVGEGTYELSEPIVLGRNVKLLGGFAANADGIEGKTYSSVLDGGSNVAIMNVTSDSQIDGFTLTNAKDSGMHISGSPIVSNCAVYGTTGAGVLISSGSPTFTNFTVSSSSAEGLLISSGSPSFTNCTITANSVGVRCEGNSSFMNCSIVGNNNSFGESSLSNSLVYGSLSGTGTFLNCALPEDFTAGNITNPVYIPEWTPVSSSQNVRGVTHAVFALTDNPALDALASAGTSTGAPNDDILGDSRLSPPTIGSLEYPYDTSYVVSIPESLSIANSGWNAVTGGISVQHDSASAGRKFTPVKKLKISASSTNGWALKSEHDQTIGYTLKSEENGGELTSWEFSPDEINAATDKTVGAYVEDYSAKPAGNYTDTLTFSVSIEDK